jgi:hypothetical protein
MGDHTHKAGEVMLSYRFMHMAMEGHRGGAKSVSLAEVLEDFAVAPVDMTMQMHMLGAMWAPCDTVTLMLMQPYLSSEMAHRTRMGGAFTTESSGLGALKATALITVLERGEQKMHLHVGVGLPTGSIDERGTTPMGVVRLPYPMQPGSGTYDLYPGVTYLGNAHALNWGGQLLGTVRLGENDNGYTLGDRLSGSVWGGVQWGRALSSSLRLSAESWGNIDGADPELSPGMVPTADPSRRGGTRTEVGLGGAFLGQTGSLAGHRLAVEYSLPLYEDLDGPQLGIDGRLTVGWQMGW